MSKAAAAAEVTYVSPGAVSVTQVSPSVSSHSHIGAYKCSGKNLSA